MFDLATLSERKREILKAIVSDYILTAEPVGSNAVTGRLIRELSAATIRNEMAELEEMGFLYQPHTSAGRLPTDKGFRVYVDHLMQLKALPMEEREEIKKVCISTGHDISELIKGVSRLLSTISNQTALAVAPKFTDTILKQIEFVRIDDNRAIVVLVSQGGIVQNRVIDMEDGLKQAELDRISGYLNDLFSGLTINEIKMRLIGEMRKEKNLYDRLLKRALMLGKEVLERSHSEPKEVFIEGQARFLEHPEFLDIDRMKRIFHAFEEKSMIIKLLDRSIKAGGVQIVIGCETGTSEFRGCSLIAAAFGMDGNVLGSVGVIGPMRMDYPRIIPIVDYTARLVGKILKEG